jgi:DNA-directed RNA polymerase specialized sigma24 family protein
MDEPSADLLQKYRAGDEQAAAELFRRYASRLTVLARARMASRIARRFDPEDVVLSAYRSFFVRARNGRFSLARSGDLWKLLVGIMLNKLHRQVARHLACKRDARRDEPLPEGGDSAWQAFAPSKQAPTAEAALAMAELVETFMAELEPSQRQVLELRLLDHTLEEIAALAKRNERTVRRTLHELARRLRERLFETGDGTSQARADRTRRPGTGILGLDIDSGWADFNSLPVAPASVPAAESEPGRGPFQSDRDFILELHLGSGGMGKVYRAIEKSSRRLVAIKMLRKSLQSEPEAVARLLDEARLAMRLAHPGIVAVRGVGRTRAGGYFLIQDFVDGQSLSQIAAARRVEVAEAARWLAEAAEALEQAHRQGVIHCDLKPANLLLETGGRIRITDFGLAHVVRPGAARRSATAGTVGFMAPEQLDPAWGAIDARTDVFGLGAVLFSLLAGRPPFTGRTVDELLRNLLAGPPPLAIHRPDAAALDAICRKCLAPAPSARFATAGELAQALSAAAAGDTH